MTNLLVLDRNEVLMVVYRGGELKICYQESAGETRRELGRGCSDPTLVQATCEL